MLRYIFSYKINRILGLWYNSDTHHDLHTKAITVDCGEFIGDRLEREGGLVSYFGEC